MTQVVRQLADPRPRDQRTTTELSTYKGLGVDRLLAGIVEHARSEADAEWRRKYGRRIRDVRTSLGMTMREFVPLIGTSAACLSSYESGKVAPTANILGRVDRLTERGSAAAVEWGTMSVLLAPRHVPARSPAEFRVITQVDARKAGRNNGGILSAEIDPII